MFQKILIYSKIRQPAQNNDETNWMLSAKYCFLWIPNTQMHLRIMFHVGLSASAWARLFFVHAAWLLPCDVLLCHPPASLFLIETVQWKNKIIFLHTSKWLFETGPLEKEALLQYGICTVPKWKSLSKQSIAQGVRQSHPALSLPASHLSWVPLGCWIYHTFGLVFKRDEYLPLSLKGSYEWPVPWKFKAIFRYLIVDWPHRYLKWGCIY